MDFSLQQSLASGYWTDAVKNTYQDYLLDGETVSVKISDQSNYFSDHEVGLMRMVVMEIDKYIDLDFVFASDANVSDIDIFLGDRSYQDYLGMATLKSSQISLEVLGDAWESYNSNLNTFAHEFMHALGIGEPGYDQRWDQDDTVMSYNQGDLVDWRTGPGAADYGALISLWGGEDDSQLSPMPIQRVNLLGDNALNDNLIGSNVGDFIVGLGGNDVINGGGGDDDLFGGDGQDIFALSQGFDRVFDFSIGVDQVSGLSSLGSYQADRYGVLVQDGGSQLLLVGIDFNDFNASVANTFV